MALLDATIPANSEAVKLGAQRIRELKTDLNAALALLYDDDATLKDASIGTDQLVALAVTAAKIAADAVTTAKILDANVTAAKLASDSVTTVKILDANVTEGKIADDAVTGDKIADDAIVNAHILDGTITNAKLATPYTTFTEGSLTVPTSGTPATRPHGLGAVPTIVQAYLVCTDAGGDRGYTQNQEVAITSFISNSSESPAFTVAKDATNIIVQPRNTSSAPRILVASDGDYATITLSKWRLKVVAVK